MKKKPPIVISILVGSVALLFILVTFVAPLAGYQVRDGKIYVRENAYNYIEPGMGACMAMMPECGVCYKDGKNGVVVGKICYLPI